MSLTLLFHVQGFDIFIITKGTKHHRQRRQQGLQAADRSSPVKDKCTRTVVTQSFRCLQIETRGIILAQITGKKIGKQRVTVVTFSEVVATCILYSLDDLVQKDCLLSKKALSCENYDFSDSRRVTFQAVYRI